MNMKMIEKHLRQAIAEYIIKSVAVFLSDGGSNQFSGILLKAQDRYFSITAGHCIQDIRDASSLRISTFERQSPGVIVEPLHFGRIPEQDLGLIELRFDKAKELNASWIDLSSINSNHASPGAHVCMLGFPSQLISAQGGEEHIASPQGFLYFSLVTSRTPSAVLRRAPDPQYDFFVEWERDNVVIPESGTPLPSINPEGMSGCGVFVIHPPSTGQVWSPTSMRLAGILSSYIEGDNLFRCNRIEHVLSLIGLDIN